MNRISWAEQHKPELKNTERCGYSCFANIFLSHRDLMIRRCEVRLSEYSVSTQVGGEVLDIR